METAGARLIMEQGFGAGGDSRGLRAGLDLAEGVGRRRLPLRGNEGELQPARGGDARSKVEGWEA